MSFRALTVIVCALSWCLSSVNAQGNVTCKTTSLDWYTSVVGETPCQTYQRLRQICNNAYTVGSLRTATPPDYCDDQLKDCCCNSISFALSMLCLNCQQGVGSGVNGDTGIDAGIGAYQLYLSRGGGTTCSPNTNQSFPADIQAAVCNKDIKIEDELYTLFWGDGAWFYIYTSQAIGKDHATYNNNTFTHCASTTVANTTSVSAATSSQISSSSSITTSLKSKASLSGGAIGGIAAAGSVTFLLALGLILRFCLNRGKHLQYDAVHPNETMAHRVEPFSSPIVHPPPTSSSAAADPNYGSLSTPPNQSSKMRSISGSQSQSQSNTTHMSAAPTTPTVASSELTDRHLDAGPLPDLMLQRSPSGRLPPAYGEQRP